jgi:hypothetical protein
MKRKPSRFQRRGGYVVIASLLAVGLGMAAFSSGLLLNSYRSQADALSFHTAVATDAADSAYRRDLATALIQSSISQVVAGGASPQLDAAGNYKLRKTRRVTEPNAPGPVVGGSGVTDSINSGSGVTGALPSVVEWTPVNAGGYSLLVPPEGVIRPKGNVQFLGRKFRINVVRSSTMVGSLGGGATSESADVPVSVIEMPTQQFSVIGETLSIPTMAILGSVLAKNLHMASGASIANAVTVTDDATWEAGARVGGISLSVAKPGSSSGAVLAKGLQTGAFSNGESIGAEKLSIVRSDEKGTMMQLGDPTSDAEGISMTFLQKASPTRWDAYTLPAFQCNTVIAVTLDANRLVATVSISSRSTDTLDSRIASPSSAVAPFSLSASDGEVNGVTLTRSSADRALIQVNPVALATVLGAPRTGRSIYVDVRSATGKRLGIANELVGVKLSNLADLQSLGGFSLVTPNTLMIAGSINTVNPVPLSIFASNVIYGASGAPNVVHSGQKQLLSNPDIADVRNDAGVIPTAKVALTLMDRSGALDIPPVTLKRWLVVNE